MNHVIMLNSENRVAGTTNKFSYKFPTATKLTSEDTIALSNINLYNSFFNVEKSRGNNTLKLKWNADTTTEYEFVIPDGFYDIASLNYLLQFWMISENLYTYSADSNSNVYYIELVINANIYGVELRFYPLPTSTEATALNLTAPSGSTWAFHATTSLCAQLYFENSFGTIIGFTGKQYYPTDVNNSNEKNDFINNITPQVSVVNSIIMTCNLINSSFSSPVNVFHSMPISAKLGDLMTNTDSDRTDVAIFDGNYNEIRIELLDQTYTPLILHDFDLSINLLLRKAKPKKL